MKGGWRRQRSEPLCDVEHDQIIRKGSIAVLRGACGRLLLLVRNALFAIPIYCHGGVEAERPGMNGSSNSRFHRDGIPGPPEPIAAPHQIVNRHSFNPPAE